MTRPAPDYARLPGRRRTLVGQNSLWLGADHLLAVDRVFFEESYRRFYFSDLQALLVRRTGTGAGLNLLWLVLAAIFALPLVFALRSDDSLAAAAWAVPVVCWLLALTVNLVQGPTCRVWVQMAVGTHELPSLRRVRQVRRLLDRLREPVARAQAGVVAAAPAGSPAPPPRVVGATAAAVRAYGGGWHLAYFLVILAGAALAQVQAANPSLTVFLLEGLVGVAILGLAIAALVAQRGTRLGRPARAAVWLSLAVAVGGGLIGYFYLVVYLMANSPELFLDEAGMWRAMAQVRANDHPFLFALSLAYALCCGVLGVIGLAGVARLRRSPGGGNG